MAQFELDTETYVLYPLFALGISTSLGLISADIIPIIDLGETALSIGGTELTFGRLLALGTIVAVFANRDDGFSLDAFGALEVWAVYATVGLIVAPPFFPGLQETLAGGAAGFVSFTVTSIGFALISWMN